jgi:hypothetical protein
MYEDLYNDSRLRSSIIRTSICEGEEHTPYSRLCLNINETGSVKVALKVRIDRMKSVYQRVSPPFVRLTDEQRE